jgi:hypothetical protein
MVRIFSISVCVLFVTLAVLPFSHAYVASHGKLTSYTTGCTPAGCPPSMGAPMQAYGPAAGGSIPGYGSPMGMPMAVQPPPYMGAVPPRRISKVKAPPRPCFPMQACGPIQCGPVGCAPPPCGPIGCPPPMCKPPVRWY